MKRVKNRIFGNTTDKFNQYNYIDLDSPLLQEMKIVFRANGINGHNINFTFKYDIKSDKLYLIKLNNALREDDKIEIDKEQFVDAMECVYALKTLNRLDNHEYLKSKINELID